MKWKQKDYKLKQKEIENKIKSGYYTKGKGDKTEKDEDLKELTYLLKNVALPNIYQDTPIEGTGDIPFELALRKKIAEKAKQKLGVSQQFAGARNRGNLTEAIGKAYSQLKKTNEGDVLELGL